MHRPHLLSMFGRLVLGAACVASASCGGDLLRTGRSPVYMVVTSLQGVVGGATSTAVLLSDVQSLVNNVATISNDNATASVQVVAKNPSVGTTAINAVTLTRYRVNFRRSDGRNTPGVDVPYGFDGALTGTIAAGASGAVSFDLIRHQAKLEPPLRNLVGRGGQGFISAIAEVTFFGRDQNGNELTTTAQMDVQFGDF